MNNLKSARMKKGIKATDLAKALNVSKQTLSNWENNKRNPDIEIYMKLADFYGCSVDYLCGREKSNKNTDILELLLSIPEYKRELLMKLLLN